MTIKEALIRARETLIENAIEDAPLECEILLRHALNITRVQLYQDIDRQITPEQESIFWHLIERRLNHEPTAYITGHWEFYGLDFYVDPRVLIPRSGTELLVEKALETGSHTVTGKKNPYLIADIGTGSGAVAIILAQNLPQARVYAIDISTSVLEVTTINCRKHGVEHQVELLSGNLLNSLPEPVDLIVANLPYIRDREMEELSPEIRLFEPRLALAGGGDGLDKIRELCHQAKGKLNPGGSLLLEIGLGQAEELSSFLRVLYPSATIKVVPDYAGIDRVVGLTLPGRRKNLPYTIHKPTWLTLTHNRSKC